MSSLITPSSRRLSGSKTRLANPIRARPVRVAHRPGAPMATGRTGEPGRPCDPQRQDDGAGQPDLVPGQGAEIGILDIVDARGRQIVVMDRERQSRPAFPRRRRLAFEEACRRPDR